MSKTHGIFDLFCLHLIEILFRKTKWLINLGQTFYRDTSLFDHMLA